MNIRDNHGIINQGGRIEGGATVQNRVGRQEHHMQNHISGPVGVLAERAENFTQNQHNAPSSPPDMKALADELARLRAEARKQATDAEHDVSVGAIAQAEVAAKEGDEDGVWKHLAAAGNWALEVATTIGTTVATEAIRRALGMPA